MIEDYISILWHEFFAEEGSFLLKLRVQLDWDRDAFKRLTEAMTLCCKKYERMQDTEEQRLQAIQVSLPRWLASGFWYIPSFVRNWTAHPSWQKERDSDPVYFNKAYEQLDHLALWFFEGIEDR